MARHEDIPGTVGVALVVGGALVSGLICGGPTVLCAFTPDTDWACVAVTFLFMAPFATVGLYMTIPGFAMIGATRAGRMKDAQRPNADMPLSD